MTLARTPLDAQTRAASRRSLIGPWVDFWLLGGASIGFCLLFALAEPLRGIVPAFEGTLLEIAAAAFLLSVVVNFPHFIASYRLAYGREREFVQTHRLELVLIPAALSVFVGLGVLAANGSVSMPFGSSTDVLAGLAIAMFVTVGWHYVKQIYGCVRVTAAFDGYQMPEWQMKVIRYGLFPLWIQGLVLVGDATQRFDELSYPWFSSPQLLRDLVNVGVAVGAMAIVGAFVANLRRFGQWPSLRMLVPILAIYVWWVPAARFGFPLPLVPFFHSLQYLPFVAKVERSKAEDRLADEESAGVARADAVDAAMRRLIGIYVALVVAGFAVFFLLPAVADGLVGSTTRSGFFTISVAVSIAINVHHYFIDHVIWRMRDDPKMRSLLLR